MADPTPPSRHDDCIQDMTRLIRLDQARRFALPARFCEQANLRPGDCFLLRRCGNQLVLTPLADAAERMREELRSLLGDGVNLSDDLLEMRSADCDDESRRR
jgi:bifunctional DNA-binding transcriptional regulator/antitoxin component of YhaV-PrlF toxin-antitoxin module